MMGEGIPVNRAVHVKILIMRKEVRKNAAN